MKPFQAKSEAEVLLIMRGHALAPPQHRFSLPFVLSFNLPRSLGCCVKGLQRSLQFEFWHCHHNILASDSVEMLLSWNVTS